MLADWIGADMKDVEYTCAGINHQAFYIQFLVRGEDAYPAIRKAVEERPEIYQQEIVRNEMFKALGYYVTESSGHNSEYNPWFRKRPDLIEKYCTHSTNWNPGVHAFILNEYRDRENAWRDEIEKWFQEPLDLARGYEYAAYILNATLGDGTISMTQEHDMTASRHDVFICDCIKQKRTVRGKKGWRCRWPLLWTF